uniref:Uncharacterized protein n=1 Tax=Geospiza parvula TaxID=87175 RepID=A0A8U8AWY0_GEOPR
LANNSVGILPRWSRVWNQLIQKRHYWANPTVSAGCRWSCQGSLLRHTLHIIIFLRKSMGIGLFTASVFTQHLSIREKGKSTGKISQRYSPTPGPFLLSGWYPSPCPEIHPKHCTQPQQTLEV